MTAKILILSLISFTMVLLFQNCGGVNFASQGSTLAISKASTGDEGSDPNNSNYNDASDAQDIVECMLKPSAKIILFGGIKTGSNAEETRICMSRHACLGLINAYASVRNCTLSVGAPSTPDRNSCTDVFPGSQGTCAKAKILTDPVLNQILADMSHQ